MYISIYNFNTLYVALLSYLYPKMKSTRDKNVNTYTTFASYFQVSFKRKLSQLNDAIPIPSTIKGSIRQPINNT